MKRKQFTFYYSFYDVISCMEEPRERAEAYDVLCRYALLGEKPDFEKLSLGTKMAVKAFMPTLDAARKKAAGGMKGTSKKQDTNKISTRCQEDSDKISGRCAQDTANKNKDKIEIKTEEKIEEEKENENEIEHESEAAFDLFWEQYPRKVKKQQAREAFQRVSVSLDVLLQALSRQKETSQWQEDGGRFVPYPAAWLQGRRWEDEISQQGTVIPKGCGPMKRSEFNDISKLMGDGGGGG